MKKYINLYVILCYHYFKARRQACVCYYELGLINPESADEFKPAMPKDN
jgi:hypothetical protein